MNALDDPERPLPALTLTIKTAGAPTVQLTYDPDRPIQETAVTLLDHRCRRVSPPTACYRLEEPVIAGVGGLPCAGL
jgi:hypothetical protein